MHYEASNCASSWRLQHRIPGNLIKCRIKGGHPAGRRRRTDRDANNNKPYQETISTQLITNDRRGFRKAILSYNEQGPATATQVKPRPPCTIQRTGDIRDRIQAAVDDPSRH